MHYSPEDLGVKLHHCENLNLSIIKQNVFKDLILCTYKTHIYNKHLQREIQRERERECVCVCTCVCRQVHQKASDFLTSAAAW
jgi:hypothetical protein